MTTTTPTRSRARGAMRAAGVLGFLGVALGAFGAHALKEALEAAGTLDTWRTGVLYHLVHSVAMLAVAAGGGRAAEADRPFPAGPCWCFAAGILLFSGSLYVLALGGPSWLGPVTPLGGVALLAGWLWLVVRT